MAEEPEVIQEQMEETRSALAEKLGALTEKISGTVETVTETVENVQETVSHTVEAVAETVENVGETAEEVVENVKETFNIPKQFDRHPWLFFGGSILLGFVGGKMLLRTLGDEEHDHGQPSSRTAGHMTDYMEQASVQPPLRAAAEMPQSGRDWGREVESTNGHGAAETREQESTSWLGGLVQNFLPDLNKVKELALGTLFATARDLVSQNLPQSIRSDVQNLFNDMTEHAGGKPIQGSVLEEGSEQQTGTKTGQKQQNSGQKEVMI